MRPRPERPRRRAAPPEDPPPKPGHGRNSAAKYVDAQVIEVKLPGSEGRRSLPELRPGKVYASPPRIVVKVVGQPPIDATIYRLETLRCRMCETTFTVAPLPEGVCASKYDPSCASLLAQLRYGSGMPFHRIEGLQASLNVPLPDSTQWDILSRRCRRRAPSSTS
jgi:transposase